MSEFQKNLDALQHVTSKDTTQRKLIEVFKGSKIRQFKKDYLFEVFLYKNNKMLIEFGYLDHRLFYHFNNIFGDVDYDEKFTTSIREFFEKYFNLTITHCQLSLIKFPKFGNKLYQQYYPNE